eukprot:3355292-Rhodomonas_salina.2
MGRTARTMKTVVGMKMEVVMSRLIRRRNVKMEKKKPKKHLRRRGEPHRNRCSPKWRSGCTVEKRVLVKRSVLFAREQTGTLCPTALKTNSTSRTVENVPSLPQHQPEEGRGQGSWLR